VPGYGLLKNRNMGSMTEQDNVEFVDAKQERAELTGFSLKSVLDGSVLTVHAFVRQIPFILFLVLLALVYIANRYNAEKVVREIEGLKSQVRDLRAEEITTASELMNLNRPSRVEALVREHNLGLGFSKEPPYKIEQ